MAERVLITGARAAAALDLARDFAAAGFEPHLADCTQARIARWSNVPAAVHHYAAPARDPAGFRADIARLVESIAPRLVIPTCEEVFHLAAPALAPVLDAPVFAPPLPLLRRLHDKHAFAAACRAWDLPVPESVLLESRADLVALDAPGAGWVLKPPFSRFGESAIIGPTATQIARLSPTPEAPLLAQRRIIGEECSLYALAHGGRISAFAAYRSQWRLGGGASFAFAPITGERAAHLRDIATQLAARAGLTGQFACDAIIDEAGQPWLIECNPRATSGVHLLTGGGDLARAIVAGTPMPQDTSLAPCHLAPAMAVFGLPLALRSGRVAEWLHTMRHSRDAISRPGDRLPLAGALADAAGFALAGLRHGISVTAATTRDIEWNGEELA